MRNFQYTDFLTSVIFHAYASAHNKLESVGPETLGQRTNVFKFRIQDGALKRGRGWWETRYSGRKKHQDDENRRKSFSNQRKKTIW